MFDISWADITHRGLSIINLDRVTIIYYRSTTVVRNLAWGNIKSLLRRDAFYRYAGLISSSLINACAT